MHQTPSPAARTGPDPAQVVDHFAAVVLKHTSKEYPSKLDHVINDEGELLSPQRLHPMFFGSFDWHSSVHGHWLLIRALRLSPGLEGAMPAIRELFDCRFTAPNVQAEVAYLSRPRRETFERTYGWAWLLKLAAELKLASQEAAGALRGTGALTPLGAAFARWEEALAPLTQAFADRYVRYLPKATYPVRVGTHNNSAFGLALSLDYARIAGHAELERLIVAKALGWYGNDARCQAWEPDGIDFLSPALMEAECMRRVLPAADFVPWLDRFLPGLAERQPATLFVPATVSDRTDGQITHLDGLNLSRAWCWRNLGKALPAGDARRPLAEQAYRVHLDSALAHVTGDYMGEHWLATFALLAMTE
ncbi:MAG TPA: DUF2891 domain-containing protein [Phycisphaerales bacterium]|nr:DUF2891 domain-containing protein [Phycisphaerales bacterium]